MRGALAATLALAVGLATAQPAPLQGVPRQNVIADIDTGVAEFAHRLLVPKSWLLRSAMGAVRWAEVGSVSEKIGVLMR